MPVSVPKGREAPFGSAKMSARSAVTTPIVTACPLTSPEVAVSDVADFRRY